MDVGSIQVELESTSPQAIHYSTQIKIVDQIAMISVDLIS